MRMSPERKYDSNPLETETSPSKRSRTMGEGVDRILAQITRVVAVGLFGLPRTLVEEHLNELNRGETEEVPFSPEAKRNWYARRLGKVEATSQAGAEPPSDIDGSNTQ